MTGQTKKPRLRGGYLPQTMLTSEAKMDIDPRMPQCLPYLYIFRHSWKLHCLPHQPSLKISACHSGSPHFPSSSPVPQLQREHLLPVCNSKLFRKAELGWVLAKTQITSVGQDICNGYVILQHPLNTDFSPFYTLGISGTKQGRL